MAFVVFVGFLIQTRDETNINADRGVAVREFPLKSGYDEAGYLLTFVEKSVANEKRI